VLLEALGEAREPRAPAVFQPRLVARAEPLQQLEHALTGAGVHHVRAESGGGLTRFLEEGARLARLRGFRVLGTLDREAAADPAPPGARTPALHALACLDTPLTTLLRREPAWEPVLRPLAPYFPVLSTALLPDLQRPSVERLFVALRAALSALSQQQRLLLCIDHVELADGLSRSFVRWLAERVEGLQALLLVGTTVLPGARHEGTAITLPRLTHAEVRRVLADVLGCVDVSPALADAAYGFSRGLPLAVVELGAWRARHDDESVPTAVHEILHARLARLDAFVVRAGAFATLAGTVFCAADVAPLCGEPRARVVRALEALLFEGFLRKSGDHDGAPCYFAHDAYRRAFAARLPEQAAAALHAERARHLLQGAQSPLILREIGLHWLAAGRPAAALLSLRRASRAWAAALSYDDAIDALEEAWSHLTQLPAQALPSAARRVGHELLALYARAARHQSVFRLGQQLASASATPLERSRSERRIAVSHRMLGQYDQAAAALDRAEQHLQRARASSIAVLRERIEHAIVRARLHYVRADATRMWSVVRATLPLARALGRPAQVATLLMDAANALVSRRRYADATAALRYQRRAVAIYRRAAPGSVEAPLAEFVLAFMLLLSSREAWPEALSLLQSVEPSALALGDAALHCRIVLYTAIAQRKLGAVEACRVESERALSMARACGLRGYVGAAHACLAWVSWREAQLGLAEERLAEARTHWWQSPRIEAERASEYPFQWLAHAPLLALLVSQERYDECSPWLAELLHEAHARLDAATERALREALCVRDRADDFPLAMERCVSALRAAGYC
jgi:hypothetical protein